MEHLEFECSRRFSARVRKAGSGEWIKRLIRAVETVLRGFDLGIIEMDVGVIGEARRMVSSRVRIKLSVRDVFLQTGGRRERSSGFLAGGDAEIHFATDWIPAHRKNARRSCTAG